MPGTGGVGREENVLFLPWCRLAIAKADEHIKKIPNKSNTVLFLDAFDEDTLAIHDHRTRLEQILKNCEEFLQVLITCRSQFFERDEEIPREAGMIKIGATAPGKSKGHAFYKLYYFASVG